MADIKQLERALVKADAAGDTAAAKAFAREIRKMRAAPAAAAPSAPEPSFFGDVAQNVGNLAAGAVRGAGSIGATIMYPIDKGLDLYHGDRGPSLSGLVTGKQPLSRNQERRQKMDEGLASMGAETDSALYATGKIAGEVAGTAGAGGVVGNGLLRLAPGATKLASAISSGGFRVAGAPAPNMLLRATGGAVSGGAAAGLVDPNNMGLGAGLGAALPTSVRGAAALGGAVAGGIEKGANRLMQSALKPTIAQLKSGDAALAVKTMLERGINPTQGGVNKLRDAIDGLNEQISQSIAGSTATVSKSKVLNALADVRTHFGNQVSPTADLAAIQSTADDFLAHPNLLGDSIPVAAAQQLKQGTYKILSKKYGQIGSAEVEAQKGLARGLKDEIAEAVPGIAGMNKAESDLIRTLNVAERRALMSMNNNPMGLAALTQSPASWAMFMADKSTLFKSLAARMLNTSGQGVRGSANRLNGLAERPLVRGAVPAIAAD